MRAPSETEFSAETRVSVEGETRQAVTGQAQLGYRAAEVGCGTTVDLPWRRVSLVSNRTTPPANLMTRRYLYALLLGSSNIIITKARSQGYMYICYTTPDTDV